jgi:nitrile hydratase beta subunit
MSSVCSQLASSPRECEARPEAEITFVRDRNSWSFPSNRPGLPLVAMDGIYDLGGVSGFGPVEVEADEPTFHELWEAIAFRLNIVSIASLSAYNVDEYRHAIERMDPVHYLEARYYERVLTAVASLLVEKGVLSLSDLEKRAGGRFPLARPVRPNIDDGREEPTAACFVVGQRVRVREMHSPGHTRAPRYVRGRSGVVVHVAPAFVFPDANAHGLPRRREPTYHVEFTTAELWVEDAEANDTIVVDLWQSYLEEAT